MNPYGLLRKLAKGKAIVVSGGKRRQERVEHVLRTAAAHKPLLLKGKRFRTITKNGELWIFLASPLRIRFVPIPSDRSSASAAAA